MAKYFGDACISDGEYQKDGQTKKKWMKIGTVVQQDSGSLSMHLPLFDRWVNIFPKQQNQGQQQQQPPQQNYQQQQPQNDWANNTGVQTPPDDNSNLPF